MNKFKKSLDVTKYQLLDKHIKTKIELELDRLESIADVPEYKAHIQDRKKGILGLFLPSFDYNMNIIEERTRYDLKESSCNNTYRKILDKIIQKRIYEQMENLYKNMLNSKTHEKNPDLNRYLSQILGRQMQIENLLENYDKNINILNNYNQHTAKNELTH